MKNKAAKVANLLDEVEKIDMVNIIDLVSQPTMSKDNQHILLVFKVGDPADESTHRKLGLTLPAIQARWLQSVVYAAANAVEKAGAKPGNSVLHFPTNYRVAHAPELDAAEFVMQDTGQKFEGGKGKTVITFDAEGPAELNFVLMNGSAMALAAALRAAVAPRLTEGDKEELKAAKVPV